MEAYHLVYKQELSAQPDGFHESLFDRFNGALFGNDPIIGFDGSLLRPGECEAIGCLAAIISIDPLVIGTSSCFTYCTCNDALNLSGIVDTPEERAWRNGNCVEAGAISGFLEGNDIGNNQIIEAGNVFLEIGIFDVFSLSEFSALIDAIDDFFIDPNSQERINELQSYLYNNNIGLFTEDVQSLTTSTPVFNGEFPLPWNNMNAQNYYGRSQPQKANLINNYMPQENYIVNNWACRVLGGSHEEATIESLGIAGSSIPILGKIPDGYTTRLHRVNGVPYFQPIIVEMKFKGTSGDFTYTNQMSQFNAYRTYLKNPNNTIHPQTTITHGLYIVLPADKNLSQNVIELCSNDNIPLYYSGVEYNPLSPGTIRVKKPELLNISELNHSGYSMGFLGDTFWKHYAENYT